MKNRAKMKLSPVAKKSVTLKQLLARLQKLEARVASLERYRRNLAEGGRLALKRLDKVKPLQRESHKLLKSLRSKFDANLRAHERARLKLGSSKELDDAIAELRRLRP